MERGSAPELDCSAWKPSSGRQIPDSLCCVLLLSLQVLAWSHSGHKGLDALHLTSKSHGCDLLVLLLDGRRAPLVFLGAGEERGFFFLPHSPLQMEFSGVVAPACAAAVVLSVLQMV